MKQLVLLFLLAGCAAPEPIFKPVTVDMPVALPCVTAPVAPPDFALTHAVSTDNLFDKTRAALIELDQRKAYERELEAQLKACES